MSLWEKIGRENANVAVALRIISKEKKRRYFRIGFKEFAMRFRNVWNRRTKNLNFLFKEAFLVLFLQCWNTPGPMETTVFGSVAMWNCS